MARDRYTVVVHVLLLRECGAAGNTSAAEVFLLRRAGTGFMDGYHVPPGGHVQAGESLEQAAARECREETGAAPHGLRPLCVLPYRSGAHQGINMIFEAPRLSAEPGVAEPERSDAAGWYPLTRLPVPVAPWLPDVLELKAQGQWFRELNWE